MEGESVLSEITKSCKKLLETTDIAAVASREDDIHLEIKLLQDRLPSGFAEVVIKSELSRDFSIMSTFLEALDALTVYNNGEVQGVGPSLVALVPLLSRKTLQIQHRSMQELIFKLLHMMSIKDQSALQIFLDDCIEMFLEVTADIGFPNKRACYQMLTRFSKLFYTDRGKLESIAQAIFETDQERVLFVKGLFSIASSIINMMGQTLSDGLDVNIWRKLCGLLQSRNNSAINQECRDVLLLSLRFMLLLCEGIQLPRIVSEEVSASVLNLVKVYREGEIGNALSRCLDCVYQELPDVLIRSQEEELFSVAGLCLTDQSASATLKASLLRCILVSMSYCTVDCSRLLEIWSRAHAAVLFCDQVFLSPFQRDLVLCLRESVNLSRNSDFGTFDEDSFYSEKCADGQANRDHRGKTLGKRNRGLENESSDFGAFSKIRCAHDRDGSPIPTASKSKVSVDYLHRRNEMKGTRTFEVALVNEAIKSCEYLIETLRHDKNRWTSVNSFHQLQSTIMVLDASNCPSIWGKLVNYVAQLCSPVQMAELGKIGLGGAILQVFEQLCWVFRDGRFVKDSNIMGLSEGFLNIAAIVSQHSERLEVEESSSIEAMTNCLIRAASVCPASCLNPKIRKCIQSLLNFAGTESTKECVLKALPFLIHRGLEMDLPSWIAIINRLVKGINGNTALALCIPSILSDITSVQCRILMPIANRAPFEIVWEWDCVEKEQFACFIPEVSADGKRDQTERYGFAHNSKHSYFSKCRERRIRCVCVTKLEQVMNLDVPVHHDQDENLHGKFDNCGSCSVLSQNVSDTILKTLRHLLVMDSEEREPITASILRSFPALLLHLNRESVMREREILQEFLNLVCTDNLPLSVRSAASLVIGTLVYDDGWGIQALFKTSSLPLAMSALQKKLGSFWALEGIAEQESHARMQCTLIALSSAVLSLLSSKTSTEFGRDRTIMLLHLYCVSFHRQESENWDMAIPFIVDIVIICIICHDREQHSLVSIGYQAIDRLGARFGGNASSIVGDPAIKKSIYYKIVDCLHENDLMFASFFAVFYSVVSSEELAYKLFDEVAPVVVPDLIARGNEDLITRFASLCQTSPEELVARQFPFIMAHLFLQRADVENRLSFESAVELALKLGTVDANSDRSTLINDNACETIDIVLWELCQFEKSEDIPRGNELFGKICELYCGSSRPSNNEDNVTDPPLAMIMRHPTLKHYYSRLMYNTFTDYFKVDGRPISDQLLALKLVNYTIPLLGVFLDEHYAYLESILKSAQHIAQLQESVCKVWSTLIRSLGPESLQIKANLSQIVVNLMSIAEVYPDLVTPTINFLLVENGSKLENEIRLIPTVETTHPSLRLAADILQKHLKQQSSLASLVDRHLHGLESGHELVQLRALVELKQTLRNHRFALANIFIGDGGDVLNTAHLVRRTVSVLLRLCSVTRHDLRVKSSECLGEIGAIDPGRIGLLPPAVRETFGNETDDEFIVEIICDHLVRILRSAGSSGRAPTMARNVQITIVERVHFSVQELLHFLGCKAIESDLTSKATRSISFTQHARAPSELRQPRNPGGTIVDQAEAVRGKANWSRLPPEVQQIVKPFLAGHLMYTEPTNASILKKEAHGPSALTYVRGMHLHRWACCFQRELITRMKTNRSRIFQVVKPLLKYDTNLSLFLLPHTVFDIICNGTDDDRDLIRDEMLHVLQETSSLEVEIDRGTVISEQGCTKFVIESGSTLPKEQINFVGKTLLIGSESRRIIRLESGNQLEVDQAFPESLFREGRPSQSYTICSPSRWNSGSGTGFGEVTAQSCGGSSITQQVFGLIECFARWLEQRAKNTGPKRPVGVTAGTSSSSLVSVSDPEKVAIVSAFISAIPKRILAETSFRCGAYDRALLYLDMSVRETWKSRLPPPIDARCDQETIKLLQRIYAGLDDVDGLIGVAKLRGRSSLEDRVLDCERAGDWPAALACYEQASQEDPSVMKNHYGLLRCLRNLGHLQTMLTHAEGCMKTFPNEAVYFCDSALQAAWRLGRWDLIDDLTKTGGIEERKKTFDFHLAQVLHDAKSRNEIEFNRNLRKARLSVLEPLAAAGMESYHRAYPFLVRLQMLSELQEIGHIIVNHDAETSTLDMRRTQAKVLIKDWDIRIQVTQPSLMGREPLLALRRVIFGFLEMKDEIAEGWLLFARAARVAGHTSTAQSAIMQADRFGACRAHIERAKLKWANLAERHESLHILRNYLDRHRNLEIFGEEQVYTKTLVLYWRWVEEMGLRQTCDVAETFEREMLSIDGRPICKHTEKTHFVLGHFYDMMAFPNRNTGSRYASTSDSVLVSGSDNARHIPAVLHHYGQSLLYGYKHIFQSLPRLLTLWFENHRHLKSEDRIKTNGTIRKLKDKLPPYIWLSVFSQLVSRICHPDPDVLTCLKEIIAKVLYSHPKQTLWSLVAVLKSSQQQRQSNAKDIRNRATQLADASRNTEIRRAMDDFLGRLVEELIKVCNLASTASAGQTGKGPKVLSMSRNCRSLASLGRLESVIVPLQGALTPSFPSKVVIRVNGSDGKEYKFLCKPKDDLRKDSRMMDLNTMINRLLAKDVDARRRNLYIRTFSVIPLNENNGLIQWGFYGSELGPAAIKTSRIQDLYNKELKPRGSYGPVDFYEKVLLPEFPPIFHKWFLDKFPAPSQWIAGRNAYIRTVAVWSMVGYVVGLGDRHAENILFDATTGDCVHVDFSCLFNKGESLAVPERVPFRLTPNLVDAMGICGYQSGFTEVCGVAMKVLRLNKDSLMNVLETFLHDPLVEWIKKQDEVPKILSRCERRLQGEVTRYPTDRDIRQVLSVDGQVRAVIAEAVSSENLSQMYRWWMPWF